MSQYVYLVPLFPLIGFLINGLFRNSVSKSVAGFIGSGTILASFIVSVAIFFQVKQAGFQPVTVTLFEFIHAGKLSIPFSFLVDPLSVLFLLIITGVGFLIHVYSVAYMHEENAPDYAKYFCYLNLFVFSMLLLVLGANFVILFIGWEGVGLCSYLLIGYWFKNLDYGNAAKKAFIMNRIGDLGFLIAIFALISQFGLYNTLPALILTYLIFTLPFTIWVLTSFFQAMPKDLEEAAYVDGATAMETLYKVMLPLILPGLVTTGLLSFIGAWNEFLFALSFTQTPDKYTVPIALFNFTTTTGGGFEIPWGPIMAATIVVTVPLITLTLIFQRRILGGLTAGAVKG